MNVLKQLQQLAIAAALWFPLVQIYGEIERYSVALGIDQINYLTQFHPLELGHVHLPTLILAGSLPAAWVAAGDAQRLFDWAGHRLVAANNAVLAYLATNGDEEE